VFILVTFNSDGNIYNDGNVIDEGNQSAVGFSEIFTLNNRPIE
jgi:hypothetical protein